MPKFTANACQNKNLETLVDKHGDILFHFGFNTFSDNFKELFSDVKYVLMGGSPGRMKLVASMLIRVVEKRGF